MFKTTHNGVSASECFVGAFCAESGANAHIYGLVSDMSHTITEASSQ